MNTSFRIASPPVRGAMSHIPWLRVGKHSAIQRGRAAAVPRPVSNAVGRPQNGPGDLLSVGFSRRRAWANFVACPTRGPRRDRRWPGLGPALCGRELPPGRVYSALDARRWSQCPRRPWPPPRNRWGIMITFTGSLYFTQGGELGHEHGESPAARRTRRTGGG